MDYIDVKSAKLVFRELFEMACQTWTLMFDRVLYNTIKMSGNVGSVKAHNTYN